MKEWKMVFSCGFFCLKGWLSGFTQIYQLESKFGIWVVKTGHPPKWPRFAKDEFCEMKEKTLDLGQDVLKGTEYDKTRPHKYYPP